MPTKPKSKPAKPPTLAELRKAARRVYGRGASVSARSVGGLVSLYASGRTMADPSVSVVGYTSAAARRDLMTCLLALEKSR